MGEKMKSGVPVQLGAETLAEWLRTDLASCIPPAASARVKLVGHLAVANRDDPYTDDDQ